VPAALLLLGLLPALGLLAGTALGALARRVAAPARSRPLRGSAASTFACLVGAFAAVPLVPWVHSVFSGPRISRLPGRVAVEVLAVGLLAGLIALTVRLLLALRGAAASRRRGAAGPALLLALFLHWADGHLYVRTYGQVHGALALAALALGSVAARLAGVARPLPRPGPALLLALLLAALGAGVLARADRLRWTIRGRAPVGGKIVALSDPLFGAGPVAVPSAPELLAELLPPPDPGWDDRRPLLDRLFPGRRAAGVLLVTVDTLRPDRMGLYGDPHGATPHLDALGRESVHFPETRSQYPGTRFSMSSMLRGRHPACTPEFQADLGVGTLDGPPPMFAERLRSLGFRTALFVDLNEVDLASPGRFGFFREGVDRIVNVPEPSSAELARSAVEHLVERGAERTFTWIHFNDPHGPYRSLPEFPFGSSEEARYLSEVAAADAAVGLLVGGLSRAGLLDRLIVVVHSDHGEEFGEHGGRTHLTTTYEEQVRVPLLIRVPGLGAGPASASAALLDVVPTLSELLDLPRDPGLHGRSLVPQLLDRDLGLDRPVFSQVDHLVTTGDRLRAVIRGPYKLILDLGSGSRELYDLSRDPRELRNLAGSGWAVEEELFRWISAFVSIRCSGRGAEADAELDRLTARYGELSPAERDRARALVGQVADAAARRFFREVLVRGVPQEIMEAAAWLIPQEDAEGIAILLSLLRSSDDGTRRTAALMLGFYRRPEARAPLRRLDLDPDPLVRSAAAFSLSALGESVDRETLRTLLAQGGPFYPFLGRLGLALQGEDEAGVLFGETLLRRVPQLNQIVLDHLERAPRPELLRALMAVQMDLYQPTDVRTHAVRAIGRLDHPDALRALAHIERNPARELAREARRRLEERMGADAAGLERMRRVAALSSRPRPSSSRVLPIGRPWSSARRSGPIRATCTRDWCWPGPYGTRGTRGRRAGSWRPRPSTRIPCSRRLGPLSTCCSRSFPATEAAEPGPRSSPSSWRGRAFPETRLSSCSGSAAAARRSADRSGGRDSRSVGRSGTPRGPRPPADSTTTPGGIRSCSPRERRRCSRPGSGRPGNRGPTSSGSGSRGSSGCWCGRRSWCSRPRGPVSARPSGARPWTSRSGGNPSDAVRERRSAFRSGWSTGARSRSREEGAWGASRSRRFPEGPGRRWVRRSASRCRSSRPGS